MSQINNFDCLINKTMIKYKMYVIITYIFLRIYCQILLYQQMEPIKQRWNETRLMIIKDIKKQIADSKTSKPSSTIALSSVYTITSKIYPNIKKCDYIKSITDCNLTLSV